MQLTKFTHSCLMLEKAGQRIVFDPGVFSTDFIELQNIAALIITHEHPDHFDAEKVRVLVEANPTLRIFTVASVAQKLAMPELIQVVQPDTTIEVAGFNLQFVGGHHAQIYDNVPVIENIGVIVDNLLFVPGDSYFVPDTKPAWLAVPLNAPWATIQDTVKFLKAMQPQHAFAVHDGLLSEAGHSVYGFHAAQALPEGVYRRLQSGEQITLA